MEGGAKLCTVVFACSLSSQESEAEWFKPQFQQQQPWGNPHKETNSINSQVLNLVNMLIALSELQLPNLNSCIKFTLQCCGGDHQQY